MIVITGAAGFIGSGLVRKLNDEGFYDLILVDDFSKQEKIKNYLSKKYTALVNRDEFHAWVESNHNRIQFIYHLGARTNTAEFDMSVLEKLNTEYSKKVWENCVKYSIPMVFASSAATYGMGELGFEDNESVIPQLLPLNPYGWSKQNFDIWALKQENKPFYWAGVKFFNVFGPNEYHKGRMASVVLHAYQQIKSTGKLKLFRSHKPEFLDGNQQRDFVYIKDVVRVLYFLMMNRNHNGIYNLGSGKAHTFNDLAAGVFEALNLVPDIEYIDTPEDIREKYQYFTEATMRKINTVGFNESFGSFNDNIKDYVVNYLQTNEYY